VTPPPGEAEALRGLVGEAEAGERLDRVAASLLGVPRAKVQRWIEGGDLTLNGAGARPSAKVRTGDAIEAHPPEPAASGVVAEEMPLHILYEDEALLVIDKPAGLVVHPAPGHPRGTLVNGLLHHCGDLAGIGGVLRPGIVHRLDRGTSGVMVVAKHDAAHLGLAEQFKEHSIERLYHAWVRGLPSKEGGRIAQPIGRHPRDRKRMSVATRRGRAACTNWQVEERYPKSGVARLAVRPETGRTHQIRVHLAASGLPLLGDEVYGRGKRARLPVKLGRPALHATSLGFRHPVSGEALSFEAELAADLAALEEVLARRERAP
jgi:23S rRNA pseudouridine1911/1915/1917 synthase